MLKVRKIFALGFLAAALGLLVTSCVEPVDKYSVTIIGGGPGASGAGTSYEEGDLVTIYAGRAPADSEFYMWTTSNPDVVFASATSATTTFEMPAGNVTVQAWWKAGTAATKYVATIYYDNDDEDSLVVEKAAGDTVRINAVGSFSMWVAVDVATGLPLLNVKFGNALSRSTYFIMPNSDVRVFAVPEDVEPDDEVYVRYTWEAAQLPNIHMISASYDDVEAWYTDVYTQYEDLDDSLALLHISHRPFGEGSPLIPDGLYVNFTMGDEYDTTYKGVFLPIEVGEDYTAICTVIDPVMKDTFDIVANYDIIVKNDKVFFEIGFDVGLFLEGDYDDPDLFILPDAWDNPDHKPNLEKSRVKAAKFLKKVKKDNVTYYVFRRAKK